MCVVHEAQLVLVALLTVSYLCIRVCILSERPGVQCLSCTSFMSTRTTRLTQRTGSVRPCAGSSAGFVWAHSLHRLTLSHMCVYFSNQTSLNELLVSFLNKGPVKRTRSNPPLTQSSLQRHTSFQRSPGNSSRQGPQSDLWTRASSPFKMMKSA